MVPGSADAGPMSCVGSQALDVSRFITRLRMNRGLLDASGVSGLMALLKTCPWIQVGGKGQA